MYMPMCQHREAEEAEDIRECLKFVLAHTVIGLVSVDVQMSYLGLAQHLGCIAVAKLPPRQPVVSRPANPHVYLRRSSVEDLPQFVVAQ